MNKNIHLKPIKNGNIMIAAHEISNNVKTINNKLFASKLFAALFLICCILFGNITTAAAQTPPEAVCSATEDGLDTEQFKIKNITIITDIVTKVKQSLLFASSAMYTKILLNAGFVSAVSAALTLYIAIYGILFITGMVQVRLYDFIIRVIKIGIIATIIVPTSWLFFNDTVVKFFNEGTEELINFVTGVGGFGSTVPFIGTLTNANTAFSLVDSAISKIISAKMFVTIMSCLVNGVYGIFFAIAIVTGVFLFMKSILFALWIYIMSLVVKAILLGLAPIFIPTILFQRTRHIFDGWVNQLINASLQPILLFTFFTFFVKLLEGSTDNILRIPSCFVPLPEGWRGSSVDFSFWQFMILTGDPAAGPLKWRPNIGGWDMTDQFPISLIAVLTFIIIADLASRFNDVVIQIAMQLSQASTSLAGAEGPMSAISSAVRQGAGYKGASKISRTPIANSPKEA